MGNVTELKVLLMRSCKAPLLPYKEVYEMTFQVLSNQKSIQGVKCLDIPANGSHREQSGKINSIVW